MITHLRLMNIQLQLLDVLLIIQICLEDTTVIFTTLQKLKVMDTKYELHGPELSVPVSQDPIGKQLFENLLKHQHLHNALIDAVSGETVSYTTLLEKTCLLANSFTNYGLKQNSVIGICSENNLQFFYPVIAAMYLGATVTTFNPSYTIGELIHTANVSKPQIIFCTKLTLPTVLKANIAPKLVVLDNNQNIDNTECLYQFIINYSTKGFTIKDFKPVFQSTEDVAFMLYSSGTTGLPKGVMLTHKNVNVKNAISRDPRYNRDTTAGSGCVIGLLPFYHAYGLFTTFHNIELGKTVVVMRKFDEKSYLKTIQDYKITVLYLVPPLAVVLAKSTLLDKYDLSSVVEVGCGAAPLGKETIEILKTRLNLKHFLQAYGMTETTLGVISMPTDHERDGSCGKVYPLTSVKVVDIETGQALGPNQNGELCFKSDLIMKGYAGDEEATKNVFDVDGWFHSGDIGYYDEDGFFYIVDRLKELIKYKGFQVPPAELGLILLTHPKIKDAGVVGLPDELAGELPLAFIVRKNKSLTEDDVENYIAGQVSPQKHLRGGVRFVNEIPRNPSGKILRRKLRDLLRQQKSKL
ncbi:hypothetical protein ILUMI_26169 [Ignelater luminosus]|uniref:Luciferin 4-monooxygenase n=1 Tax=Ignelater luminosus TaxID=2038154 RepID=A0A8K0C413_IGNLU|nr:hypothetical protein ILUMI_26169 [Ignelater luminosus]